MTTAITVSERAARRIGQILKTEGAVTLGAHSLCEGGAVAAVENQQLPP